MLKLKFPGLIGALLALALTPVACVDVAGAGSTSGTAVYAFDSSSGANYRVLIWDDANTLYSTPTTAPTRQIASSLLDSVTPLAWGGMALDTNKDRLYLVSTSGTVVRIESIREKATGTLSSSTDIVNFTLSSSDRLPGTSVFYQASVDSATDTLYVQESNDTTTQLWVVSGASKVANTATVSHSGSLSVSGDTGGYGIAAGSGSVYAYFNGGSSIPYNGTTYPQIQRLRAGSASAGFTQVLIWTSAASAPVSKWGSLALDTSDNWLYVAQHDTDAGSSNAPIAVFTTGQFKDGYSQTPKFTLGTASAQGTLRAIAHPGTKDWLAGITSSSDKGSNVIWLWKQPSLWSSSSSSATDPVQVTLSSSTAQIRGLAMDGNN